MRKMMEKAALYITLFCLGGGLYCCLEVLWRGYTHWSMAPVGGICVLLINAVDSMHKNVLLKMLLCGLGITAVEGIGGLIFNIYLQMNVWDYSDLYLNLFGQICLLFTVFWIALSYPGMWFCRVIRRYIFA